MYIPALHFVAELKGGYSSYVSTYTSHTYRWLLSQSPAGATCLMPSLEMAFSEDTYTYSRGTHDVYYGAKATLSNLGSIIII